MDGKVSIKNKLADPLTKYLLIMFLVIILGFILEDAIITLNEIVHLIYVPHALARVVRPNLATVATPMH